MYKSKKKIDKYHQKYERTECNFIKTKRIQKVPGLACFVQRCALVGRTFGKDWQNVFLLKS